jgi:membrane protease YdiL (CAAX protease family)
MSTTEATSIQMQESSAADARPHPLRATAIYALAVALGGALLAPWLYRLAQSLPPSWNLAHIPFHRFMDRALWGITLAGVWPFLRSAKIKSWRELGLVNPSGQWRRLAKGFLLGLVSLAGFTAVVLLLHGRQINGHVQAGEVSATHYAGRILTAAATGVAVALLEEIFFRGVLCSGIRKTWDWPMAILVSSGIYALIHFIGKADPATVTWSSGLEMLPAMMGGFANRADVVPGFFNLLLTGILLALAYRLTGNLYFSIGLHAGWVFSLKLYGFLTVRAPEANVRLWGTEKFTDGWLALLVMILTLLFLIRLPAARSRQST